MQIGCGILYVAANFKNKHKNKNDSIMKKNYTPEFKKKAVDLAMNLSLRDAAKQLEMPMSTLSSWVNQEEVSLTNRTSENTKVNKGIDVKALLSEKENLEERIKNANEDMAILKKAFIILSRTT